MKLLFMTDSPKVTNSLSSVHIKYWQIWEQLFVTYLSKANRLFYISSVNRLGSRTHSNGRSLDIAGVCEYQKNNIYRVIEFKNESLELDAIDVILDSIGTEISQLLTPNWVYDQRFCDPGKVKPWSSVPVDFRKRLKNNHQDHFHITLKRR